MRYLIVLLLISFSFGDEFKDSLRRIQMKINERVSLGSSKDYKDKLEVPSLTRVYSQEDLRFYNSVYELLSYIAGISVEEGQFNSQYINARGHQNYFYDTKVLISVNGLRFESKMTSANKVNIIPISAIKRLEVSMGSASSLYGSNAYALEVFITTVDKYEYLDSSLKTTFGSFGSRDYSGNLVLDDFIASFQFSDTTFRNSDPKESDTYNPTAEMVNRKTLDDFTLFYEKENFSVMLGSSRDVMDFTYLKEDFSSRSPIFPALAPGWHGTKSEFKNDFITLKHKQRLNNTLLLRSFGRYLKYSRDLLSDSLPYFNYNMGSESINLEAQLHWKPSRGNNFIAGFSYDNSRFYHKTDTAELNALPVPPALRATLALPPVITNLYQVVNGGVPFPDTFYMVKPDSDISKGLFFRHSFQASKKLELVNSFRIDNNELFRTTSSNKHALIYNYESQGYFKFIYNNSFRYPHMGEAKVEIPWMFVVRSPEDIHEESIKSYEFIWGKRFKSSYLNLSFSRMKVVDGIYMVPAATAPFIHPGNLHAYTSDSLELEYEKNYRNLLWKVEVSFNDKNNKEMVGVKIRPGNTKRMFSSIWKWTPIKKWDFFYGLNIIGPRMESITDASGFAIASGTYTGSVALSSFKTVFHSSNKEEWVLSINNLFNKQYHYINYLIADGHENPLPAPRFISLAYKIKF